MKYNIHTLNYIVTDTELDAFIEECRLIKEIKPRYNKQQGASYLTRSTLFSFSWPSSSNLIKQGAFLGQGGF